MSQKEYKDMSDRTINIRREIENADLSKEEQKILEQLRQGKTDIEIPDCLMPDVVDIKRMELEKEKKAKKKRLRYLGAGVLAACVLVGLGVTKYSDANSHPGTVVVSPGSATGNLSISDPGQEDPVDPVDDPGANGGNRNMESALDWDVDDGGRLTCAASYDEIYEHLRRNQEESGTLEVLDGDAGEYAVTDSAAEAGIAATNEAFAGAKTEAAGAAVEESTAKSAYSTTNTREADVDEADTAKTDGTYLYVQKENARNIVIVDTRGGLREVSRITVAEDKRILEFFLTDENQKLLVVCMENKLSEDREDVGGFGMYAAEQVYTKVLSYDISDKEKPKKIGTVSQLGNYHSSRVADGYLYLFSCYYPRYDMSQPEPRTFIPMINDELMSAEDILLPKWNRGCMYEVISAVDVSNPEKVVDSKAILTEGGNLYVSSENIYYYDTEWNYENGETTTSVRKIAYKSGVLTAEGSCSFDGQIHDSFCIDEYDGYLRVVVTNRQENAVYVFNDRLKKTGAITGLAEDERVYSARFLGKLGYFVTFRETDPLFAVDLSDPAKPKILGQLKIPGFSDYLHSYGKGLLLGIGMNADENGMTDGVKLTMFDTSDPGDPTEAHTFVIKNAYSTEVSTDYKAVLIDGKKNLIGVACETGDGQIYYVFSYDKETGFEQKMAEEINGSGYRTCRGFYIDETLYVVKGNIVEAYSLVTFAKIDDYIL